MLIATVTVRATEANKEEKDDDSVFLRRYHLPGAGGSGPFEAVLDLISAFEAKYTEIDLSISSVGTGASQSALWGDVNCDKKWIDGVCAPSITLGEKEEQDHHDHEDSGSYQQQQTTTWGIGGVPLDSESKEEHNHLGLHHIPAFGGPILVVYSKDVTGELGLDSSQQINMSYATIANIFSGNITFWDDPSLQKENPEIVLPHEPITVLVRSDKSGMSQTFTEFLHHTNPETWPIEAVGKKPTWPLSNITDLSDSSFVQDDDFTHWKGEGQTGLGIGLLRRPFSIGYLELGYFSTLTQFVAQVHVSGPNHPTNYEPATVDTLKEVMDGLSNRLDATELSLNMVEEDTPIGGYPISRYIYWYIKTSAQSYSSCYQAWLFATFLEWVYTDSGANRIALNHGWVIPPTSVVDKVFVVLDQIECTVADGEEGEREGLHVGDTIFALDFTPAPFRETLLPEHEVMTWTIVFAVCVPVSILAFVLLVHLIFQDQNRKRADNIWIIQYSEVTFGNPPEVVGAGTFGLVVLGNYRGTDVAVKRVIPPSRVKVTTSIDAIEEGAQTFKGELESFGYGPRSKYANAPSRAQLQSDFMEEMRYLSKLRHPCITMSESV